MAPETAEILKNGEVIALDQDVLGKQGFCYRDNGDYEIWIKKLANNEKAACLLNRGDEVKEVQVDFNTLLKASDNYWSPDSYKLADYKVRDLWEHKDVSLEKSVVFIKLQPHSVKVFRFIKK
jgi:alpha-galactosidase